MHESPKLLEVESDKTTEQNDLVTTTAAASQVSEERTQDAAGQDLYLIGRPELRDFLRYVKHHAINRPTKGCLSKNGSPRAKSLRTLKKPKPVSRIAPRLQSWTSGKAQALPYGVSEGSLGALRVQHRTDGGGSR